MKAAITLRLLLGCSVFFTPLFTASLHDAFAENTVPYGPPLPEKFGPPLPSYPALESPGDVYPVFMDRKDERKFSTLLRALDRRRFNMKKHQKQFDREMKTLTPAMKAAMEEEYFQRKPEDHYAKDLLVQLLGYDPAKRYRK